MNSFPIVSIDRLWLDMKTNTSFYLCVLGFIAFQLVTDVIASYATQVTVALEIGARVFFFVIQTIILLLFETGVTFYQLRLLTILWLTSLVKAMSCEASPLECFVVLAVVITPLFGLADEGMAENTQARLSKKKSTEDDNDLPFGVNSQYSSQGSGFQTFESPATKLANMTKSILVLIYLMMRRDALTPDFFHFVSCVFEDEGHLIWVFIIWTCYKGLLVSSDKTETGQIAAMAIFETIVAMTLCGVLSLTNAFLYAGLITVVYLASRSSQYVTCVSVVSFAGYYMTINFWINLIDFVWNKLFLEIHYYHDDDFLLSFSYKMHQFLLCAILAIETAQFIQPTVKVFRKLPEGLTFLHYYSIFINISMFFCFLLELTWFSAEKRGKIFKTELTKVFMTIVVFYFISLWLTTWMFSMATTISNEITRKEEDIQMQRSQHDQYIKRLKRSARYDPQYDEDRLPKLVLMQTTNESEQIVADFEAKGIKDQNVIDTLNYMVCRVDVYLNSECHHLLDKMYKSQLQTIQNISATMFFLSVHVPLARMSPAWSFLTAFTVWLLDNKTKAEIYRATYKFAQFFANPQAFVNSWRKRESIGSQQIFSRTFDFDQDGFTKRDKDDQKAAIDWTVLNLSIFLSIFLNYCYSSFLHETLGSVCMDVIKIFDFIGLEVHFVRFIYWAVFDSYGGSLETKWLDLMSSIQLDSLSLLLIILPLFLMSLHFLTAPIKQRYNSKMQAFLAPISLLPLFWFHSWDVCCLSIHVTIMNMYCAYYISDQDEYESYS